MSFYTLYLRIVSEVLEAITSDTPSSLHALSIKIDERKLGTFNSINNK
ncbi:10869_t:CDS:2 [Funneliformis mosseae]|uniref:10869_t:CDS:1 n=1 Tax=Funneliformis mosseae TaxID=27381 RepID=A0A9N9FJX5_FUNMO|nr:10869_t:CDS:2 [Funneliformis mosseae]